MTYPEFIVHSITMNLISYAIVIAVRTIWPESVQLLLMSGINIGWVVVSLGSVFNDQLAELVCRHIFGKEPLWIK